MIDYTNMIPCEIMYDEIISIFVLYISQKLVLRDLF